MVRAWSKSHSTTILKPIGVANAELLSSLGYTIHKATLTLHFALES